MRKLKKYLFTWQVHRRFPGWRLDWVGVNKATLTRPDGKQYQLVFPAWSWQSRCLSDHPNRPPWSGGRVF